jgi:hypothetical protein
MVSCEDVMEFCTAALVFDRGDEPRTAKGEWKARAPMGFFEARRAAAACLERDMGVVFEWV